MEPSPENTCRLAKAFSRLRDVARQVTRKAPIRAVALPIYSTPPETSIERREASLSATAVSKSETFLYLAYGSNLCNETFRGKRGIKPLSQINVQIPELRLTFDLPGIAYAEPCFANTGRRDPEKDLPSLSEKEGIPQSKDYHKNRWHKGLIGVVYEVTSTDYAHIIATEGGGASYQDILVDCYPFESSDPAQPVPVYPTTTPFKAHTLFAPAIPPGVQPPKEGGRIQRPDTSYAQASARYLKLITDGAAECELPYEYQNYLKDIRPYKITSNKQQMGQFVFLTLWLPFIVFIFTLNARFADKAGRTPPWLRILSESIFRSCWRTYDGFFKPIFGDGERTTPADEQDTHHTRSQDTRLECGTITEEEKDFLAV
ncbi:hypothetical protein E4T39_02531 [Aureobasidium subglaciale]|nr:hypothetical protein E4T39_02531 [Aureobasidium subglaciale]